MAKQKKQDERVAEIRKTHENWEGYNRDWSFFMSAYEGGMPFAQKGNIFKHQRETQEDYEDRVSRVHPINYCEPLVDFYTNFIFSETIERTPGDGSEFYNSFVKDVNRRGDNIDTFMRGVSDDMQIFGMSYILVDMPRFDPSAVVTKADEEVNKIRPYWVSVKPQEVIDWALDSLGNLAYVKRLQTVQQLSITGGYSTIERYTEYQGDMILVSEIDVTVPTEPVVVLWKDLTPSPVGKIPFAIARYKRAKSDSYCGLSFLRDFAYNNREIINQTSLLQEFLYRQAFNILAREVDTTIPLTEQQDGVVGTSNVLDYPKGANAPAYISPASDPAQFIADERGRIEQGMFKRAAQDALTELFNGEKSSGYSQTMSFSKTVPFIASRADVLEETENELMILTMKAIGKEWTGRAKYKDRYDITNLSDALTQFQILARDLAIPSEAFVKAQLKRLIHEYDGKLPADTLALIDKQVDSMDFEEWQQTQKDALVGKAGSSPGDQQKSKQTGTMAEVKKESVKTGSTNAVKR